MVEISQNFVAFSEYMNFTYLYRGVFRAFELRDLRVLTVIREACDIEIHKKVRYIVNPFNKRWRWCCGRFHLDKDR